MFLVDENDLEEVTISNLEKFRDFINDTEKYKYWAFLKKQLKVINTQDWFDDINKVYERKNKTIAKRSFDFDYLEKLLNDWIS